MKDSLCSQSQPGFLSPQDPCSLSQNCTTTAAFRPSCVEWCRGHSSSSAPSPRQEHFPPALTSLATPAPGAQGQARSRPARPRKAQSWRAGQAKATVASGASKGRGAALTIGHSRAFTLGRTRAGSPLSVCNTSAGALTAPHHSSSRNC